MANDPEAGTRVLKSLKGAVLLMHYGSKQTIFMERFTQGMRIRMPAEKVRNLPLLGEAVSKILAVMEEQYSDFTTSTKRKREIAMVIAMVAGYIAVTYCYGLRGNEGMWVDTDRTGYAGVLELVRLHPEMKPPISWCRCWEGSRERTEIECMCFASLPPAVLASRPAGFWNE